MTDPIPVVYSCCFRFDCPFCGTRNHVEPIPCDAETTAQLLAEEGHGEGEEWKAKPEREWTPEFGQMPRVSACVLCGQRVTPGDEP